MLRLTRNAKSTITVTLKEATTISEVEYLFEFEHEQTQTKVYCILTDISEYKERYNRFELTDGVDLTFPYSGDYIYRAYEQASESSNLDPTGLKMVEKGLCYVADEPEISNQYTNSIESKVYEQE